MQIYQDGKLKWTITDVGSPSDIVFIPKNLAKSCNMSAEGFDEVFYACLSGANNNHDAYEKAEQVHVQYFDKRKYSSYQSFLSAKSQRFNK